MGRASIRYTAARVLCVAGLVAAVSWPAASQVAPLRIVSAAPNGPLDTIDQADQIRIVFSQPMIPVGAPTTGVRPPWITMAPELAGHYYWSGTRALMFSPDVETRVPFATRVTIRVDASAASESGQRLDAPYEFSFATPTVRLLRVDWYRKTGRHDSPAVLALYLNQPVRPEDVAEHARVSLAPHDWRPPSMGAVERQWLLQHDPKGLARFDAKVAEARRVAASSDPIPIRLSQSWNEERFPRRDNVVVVETTRPPPVNARLSVAMAATMPSPDGPERAASPAMSIVLEPAFFVLSRCDRNCGSAGLPVLSLSRGADREAVARAFSIVDVTDPSRERRVVPTVDAVAAFYLPFRIPLQTLGYSLQPPMRTWQYRIDDDLRAQDGQTLGYPWIAIAETKHASPQLSLDGTVWEAAASSGVPFESRNLVGVDEWIEPVDRARLAGAIAEMRGVGLPNQEPALPNRPPRTRRLSVVPDVSQARVIDPSPVFGGASRGLFRLTLRPVEALEGTFVDGSRLRPIRSLVQVTDLGITVKDSPNSTLVFVTSLRSGAPVAGARVAVRDLQDRVLWSGETDGDGVALAPALALRPPEAATWQWSFIVTAETHDDFAYVGSDWQGEMAPWRLGASYSQPTPPMTLRGSVFTDRGVYRQGERVHLKIVVRQDTANGLRMLEPDDVVTAVVRDVRNAEISRQTLTAGRWSSADWRFDLPESVALGRYMVFVFSGASPPADHVWSEVAGTFLVTAYRRPDIRVDATLRGDPPVLGTTLRATIAARYLFGGVLPSRPVRWSVRRRPVVSVPDAIAARFPTDRFAIGFLPRPDENQETGAVIERSEALGPEGILTADVPTTSGVAHAFTYTVEGDVEDPAGQHIANRTSIAIHPASFYVALSKPSVIVDTREPLRLNVATVNLDGTVRTGVRVRVVLLREEWVRRPRRPGSDGWERREIPAGEWTIRTGVDAVPLTMPVRAGGGSYVVRATARDSAGRATRTEASFYGVGPGRASWRLNGQRIPLVPERATLAPGETARILIQSPWERATALLTIEREGIRRHQRFEVQSTQDTVEVPITEDDVPNVYVGVVLVKGRTEAESVSENEDAGRPSVRAGYTELTVTPDSKRLQVKVTADRQEYRPHGEVQVTATVRQRDGRPVTGEVTLWAIDAGILSLTGYTAPDVVRAIYARKSLQVMTEDSRVRLIARRRTVPDLVVPETLNESINVSMELPQFRGGAGAGATPLTRNEVPTIDTEFMRSLPRADRHVLNVLEFFPDGAAQDVAVRSDFRPLVFWLGSATTSADGRVTTTVTLPDSLTTYRIIAVAGDEASRFGFDEAEIRVAKPVALLPAFPRFLARGDRASFGAVVTNNGATAGEAAVAIRSLDPERLRIDDTPQRQFTVAPGASEPVRFQATALGEGTARVQMVVRIGDETDAFELALPVRVPARIESAAAYGETDATPARERVQVPDGILTSRGGLSVQLASTALVGLSAGAHYLHESSYECAEPKASRALALLLAADLGGVFGLELSRDEARAAATRAINELYAYQCGGSFAVFAGRCDTTSAYLTAYVLHVLHTAAKLGIPVNNDVVNRALNALSGGLGSRAPSDAHWWSSWAASQTFALKVLAEHGRPNQAAMSALVADAERLPIFAMSYLADALAASGDRGPRYAELIRRLNNGVRVNADRAHVEERDEEALAWLWNTNVRATAVVLDGFVRRGDAGTYVAPLARWLLAARTNGRWSTTHENAMALEALVAYYRAIEAETPNFTASASLAGSPIGRARFEGRSTTTQDLRVTMADLMRAAAGASGVPLDLSLAREGTGRLYYTARLQYAAPESPDAVDRGFHVERRYERYEPVSVAGNTSSNRRPPGTTEFALGDLVRVTVTVTLRGEGRFLVLTDALPAGLEPLDGWLKTTASDLARASTRVSGQGNWLSLWRRGTFDHVEKHDDRVVAYAIRLGSGRHEFSYLARATTPGTFTAIGTRVEAMYAPELMGASSAATVTVR